MNPVRSTYGCYLAYVDNWARKAYGEEMEKLKLSGYFFPDEKDPNLFTVRLACGNCGAPLGNDGSHENKLGVCMECSQINPRERHLPKECGWDKFMYDWNAKTLRVNKRLVKQETIENGEKPSLDADTVQAWNGRPYILYDGFWYTPNIEKDVYSMEWDDKDTWIMAGTVIQLSLGFYRYITPWAE